jgi:adenylate cyclase
MVMKLAPTLLRLRERKVVQWALAYLAGAWVLLQLTSMLGGMYDLPRTLVRAVPVLLAVGFLAALVLAWYHGEKGRQRVSGPELLMLGALLLIAGAAVAWVGGGAERPVAAAEPPGAAPTVVDARSLAVLPFADLSEAGDQKWFAEGLAEEILNRLARLGELRVSARNSSFRFEDRAVDVREIGRLLGVASVVEGSVRRDGDRLRIGVQLVRAADGFHLWSQTYDRHLDDVFAIQADIAENIARALDVVLDHERRNRMLATGTREPAAFLYYLRGRAEYEAAHQLGLETNDRLWQANDWFARALEIDPDYALARFYHHDAYLHALVGDIAVPPRYWLPDGTVDQARLDQLMRADLNAALESARGTSLEPGLALMVNFTRGEWARLASAVARFDREQAADAVEIADGGFLWFPMMIVRAFEPARELVRWALERTPLDGGLWSEAAHIELHLGNVPEAERLFAAATEVGTEHRYIDEVRVHLLIAAGRAEEVLAVEVPRLEGTRRAVWAETYALAELGRVAEAWAILEDEEKFPLLREGRCWLLARIGDQEEANACVRPIDASPLGWVQLSRMIVNGGSVPFDLEAAPRFTALYRASGAPPWPRTEAVADSPQRTVR